MQISSRGIILATILGITGCGGNSKTSSLLGQDQVTPAARPVAPIEPPSGQTGTGSGSGSGSGTGSGSGSVSTIVGPSCQNGDTSQICLALKYVVYTNAAGNPVVNKDVALTNLSTLNSTWSQCKISFQIDEFVESDPTQMGLAYSTSDISELDRIRQYYQNSNTLLVVTTGTWNRAGSLGQTGANAWTNMPGSGIYGAVLEGAVGAFQLIIAHELGHYLNLDHVSDTSDLMNPLIYSTSNQLSTSQCSAARAAATQYWVSMQR